jgi:hypothetical protein
MNKKIKLAVLLGFLCTFVEGVAGVLVIYLYKKYLPDIEAGFWIFCGTINAMMLMPVYPLSGLLIRRVAVSQTGSKELQEKCSVAKIHIRNVTVSLLFISTLVYSLTAWRHLENKILPQTDVIFGIVSQIIGLGLTLVAIILFAIITGLGHVGIDKASKIIATTVGLIITFLSLYIGMGIVGLALCFLVQNTLLVFLGLTLKTRFQPEVKQDYAVSDNLARKVQRSQQNQKHSLVSKMNSNEVREIFFILLSAAIGFLVTNYHIFYVEKKYGLQLISEYVPICKVAALLVALSAMTSQMLQPSIARSWQENDHTKHRKYVKYCIIFTNLAFWLGAILVIGCSGILFPIWLGKSQQLGRGVVICIITSAGISAWNMGFSIPLFASTGETFVGVSLINLILVVGVTDIMAEKFGIIGVPLAITIGSILPSLWVAYYTLQKFALIKHGRVQNS